MLREWVEAQGGSWLPRAPGVSASLAQVGRVTWPVVTALDEEFGGLSLYVGDREVWVGLDSALEMPAFRRVIDGREHVMIGAFTPMGWYVDETGAIAEVDSAGAVSARFASLRAALEQVARVKEGLNRLGPSGSGLSAVRSSTSQTPD